MEVQPGSSGRVFEAYSTVGEVRMTGVRSVLERAWSAGDSFIAWLCGETDDREEMERRQAEYKSKLCIKTSRGNREEDIAAQHVLVAGCHCEILPMCSTPTCGGTD